MMEFTAVCQYPGKDQFRFHSSPFWVSAWADLERTGHDLVAVEWEKISPHPAPPIVKFIPGALVHMART